MSFQLYEPKSQPQRIFQASQADMAIYGGSAFGGKTFAAILEALKWHRCAGYRAAIFRRLATDITKSGSLMDSCVPVYRDAGAEFRAGQYMDFTWPQFNSRIQLAGMEQEVDRFKWQGAQLWLAIFEELTQFTDKQWWYLWSRCRGGGGVMRPYQRGTCNPDPFSWVKGLIQPWLDTDGFPNFEMSGRLMWIARDKNDRIQHFGSSRECESFIHDIGDKAQKPISFTFVPAKITDNQVGLEQDPSAISNLALQDRVTRRAHLDGCWNPLGGGGMYFNRAWLEPWTAPLNQRDIRLSVRGWDMSYSESGKASDWTVGVLMHLLSDGRIIIADVRRFQAAPGKLERELLSVAKQDGHSVVQALWQDPAAGKLAADILKRQLRQEVPGCRVEIEPATKSKGDYFAPFSAAIDRDSKPSAVAFFMPGVWTSSYFDELEAWKGVESKDRNEHNDQVDATSRAWVHIARFGFRSGLSNWTTENR